MICKKCKIDRRGFCFNNNRNTLEAPECLVCENERLKQENETLRKRIKLLKENTCDDVT